MPRPSLYDDMKNIQMGYTDKQLTVAFWDISGYSQPCNVFNRQLDDIFIFLDKYSKKRKT